MREPDATESDDMLSFREMAGRLGLGMPYQLRVEPDGSRRFIYLGPICEAMTGVPIEAALRHPDRLYDQVLAEDLAALDAAIDVALAEWRPYQMDVRMGSPTGEIRWRRVVAAPRRASDGAILWDGLVTDVNDLKMAEDLRSTLMSELAHRAKNSIQVVMAIVGQTARGVSTAPEFERVLMARLKALADSQDLVTASGGRPVQLSEVVATTLTPFDASRFDVDEGLKDVTIAGDVAVGVGLLLHELSTNAVKYGALSRPAGRVSLRRTQSARGEAVLRWAECGGPEVRPAARKGFGSRLLEVSLRSQGGKVVPAYDPSGFRAKIHVPVAPPEG